MYVYGVNMLEKIFRQALSIYIVYIPYLIFINIKVKV